MAVQRLIQKNDPVTGQLSQYARSYLANGSFDASKDVYLGPVYQTTKGDPGESAKQTAINAGLLAPTASDADLISLITGPSAKQAAIKAGLLPSNATDAAFITLITGKTGKDSVVPGPKGDRGDPGPSPKAGLLLAASGLQPGLAVYWADNLGAFLPLHPVSHEYALGVTGIVDKDGDLIGPGNPVNLTGVAGFAAGSTYYVENQDPTGRNLQAYQSANAAALAPSLTRSLITAGRTFPLNGGVQLYFDPQVNIAPNAAAANFSRTDFTNLPYGATPAASLMARILDVPNNGGASLTGLRKDGDADTDSGFPASPVRMLVNGLMSGVFYQSMGYDFNSAHGNRPASWSTPVTKGDFLLVFGFSDGAQCAPGLIYAATATDFHAIKIYGTGTGLAFHKGTISGSTVSYSDDRAGVVIAGAQKTLMCMRLNIDGVNVKAKAWNYDLSKALVDQALSEPASWTGSYTASSALPAGLVGAICSNGKMRQYMLSRSLDPAIPAQFEGEL